MRQSTIRRQVGYRGAPIRGRIGADTERRIDTRHYAQVTVRLRVALIARALAVDPKFVLLDEPFAGVDPIAVEDIQEIIARLKIKNIGILITDHNVNETLSICDRAYLLIDGKIFTHGTAEELADNEQVRRLYLGKNFELKRKDFLHLIQRIFP